MLLDYLVMSYIYLNLWSSEIYSSITNNNRIYALIKIFTLDKIITHDLTFWDTALVSFLDFDASYKD